MTEPQNEVVEIPVDSPVPEVEVPVDAPAPVCPKLDEINSKLDSLISLVNEVKCKCKEKECKPMVCPLRATMSATEFDQLRCDKVRKVNCQLSKEDFEAMMGFFIFILLVISICKIFR
jgi:hypothetical protein